MDEQLVSLSVRLAEVAARNTAGALADRLTAVRARKNASDIALQLEEIISLLISDKNELIQIAQAFEQDLVAQRITPEQATALVGAVVPALEMIAGSEPSGASMIEPLLPLLNPEMITALQLLGFNFRRAIGEPLTQLLADYLLSKAPRPPSVSRQPNPKR